MTILTENYRFIETFDTNLTVQYEVDNWSTWHIVREIISNALDSVDSDSKRISIKVESGYITIADDGAGYSLVYAKRIGASNKKDDASSIGQFGEGTKLAVLTCLRKGIQAYLASKDWLIAPRLAPDEEGIEVMLFDIYKGEPITGSKVILEATEELLSVIEQKEQYFLHFGTEELLFGSTYNGIFAKGDEAKLFNKGVFVKIIDTLFSYALSLDGLNRDRDLLDDQLLRQSIRMLWEQVDNPAIIKKYLLESQKIGDGPSNLKEFTFTIFPRHDNKKIWEAAFHELFGGKAVLVTHSVSAVEAAAMGYTPIKLEHYGFMTMEEIVKKDVDVIRTDYAFSWVEKLTLKEQQRLEFFRHISEILGINLPRDIRIFNNYAKSDNLLGHYDSNLDEIFLKRQILNDELTSALDTFLHEQNHKNTGADDYSRSFADGLSKLLAEAVLKLASHVGVPVTLELNNRGFQLPANFQFSADNMEGNIMAIGNNLHIRAGEYSLKANIPGANFKPYSSNRSIAFYRGSFYLNVPAVIREQLPAEVGFGLVLNVDNF